MLKNREAPDVGIRQALRRVILVASQSVTVTVTAGSLLIDAGGGKRPTRLPSQHPPPHKPRLSHSTTTSCQHVVDVVPCPP